MRIGINSLFLIPNQVGGTEYFLRSFINYLQKLDRKNEYILYCNRENFDTFHLTNPKWQKILCPVAAQSRIQRILFEQVLLPFYVLKNRCQILHSWGYLGPVINFSKHFVTIHDANWKDHPEDVSLLQRIVLKVLVELNLFSSTLVLTDSDFSKRRLVHHFPNYQKKIKVIKGGIEDDFIFLANSKLAHPLKQKKYILSVGAYYPHKRTDYLLDIWEEITKHNKSLNLVLIGQNGPEYQNILKRIKNLSNVHHFPKVTFPKLVAFYKHADVFILASNYEGFGFPIYEASVFEMPIFVADSSMYDQTVQSNLLNLTTNSETDAKNILQKLGKKIKRKSNLSYEDSSKELIKLYEKNN